MRHWSSNTALPVIAITLREQSHWHELQLNCSQNTWTTQDDPFNRAVGTAGKPWNVLTSPVWGAVPLSWLLNNPAAVTPCALLDVPRSCIPPLPWHPPPSSAPFPPDGKWFPAMHPLPAASLVQMALPVPSHPHNTLKPLNHSLNSFLPQGHFKPHHNPPKSYQQPRFLPLEPFSSWKRWDKILPAVTLLSTLTCLWVLF